MIVPQNGQQAKVVSMPAASEPVRKQKKPAPLQQPHMKPTVEKEPIPSSLSSFYVVDAPSDETDLLKILQATSKEAEKHGMAPFVYYYADWCPPCQKLRNCLDHPLMTEAFEGAYVVKLSSDVWGTAAQQCGMGFQAVPIFFRLDKEGQVLDQIDGSAWGPDTPESMSVPLKQFFQHKSSSPEIEVVPTEAELENTYQLAEEESANSETPEYNVELLETTPKEDDQIPEFNLAELEVSNNATAQQPVAIEEEVIPQDTIAQEMELIQNLKFP